MNMAEYLEALAPR